MASVVPHPRDTPPAVAPTRLSRALTEAETRADVVSAFEAARGLFLAGQRIDMQDLADSLGVGRSTLHRWVGSRDELLAEIVWSLVQARFRREMEQSTLRGAVRVVEAMVASLVDHQHSGFARTWLQREPQRAMRICTTKSSPVQQRIVAMIAEALRAETGSAFTHPLPTERVAYLLVRVLESYFYSDQITGETSDFEELRVALRLILQLDPVSTKHPARRSDISRR